MVDLTDGRLEHDCGKGEEAHKGEDGAPLHCGYGEAIQDGIGYDIDARRWWIGNGEYSSPVYFCPWCGLDLETKLTEIPQ